MVGLLKTLIWRHALFDVQKVELVYICSCHQLSVFQNKSCRICPIKLKISMHYQRCDNF